MEKGVVLYKVVSYTNAIFTYFGMAGRNRRKTALRARRANHTVHHWNTDASSSSSSGGRGGGGGGSEAPLPFVSHTRFFRDSMTLATRSDDVPCTEADRKAHRQVVKSCLSFAQEFLEAKTQNPLSLGSLLNFSSPSPDGTDALTRAAMSHFLWSGGLSTAITPLQQVRLDLCVPICV